MNNHHQLIISYPKPKQSKYCTSNISQSKRRGIWFWQDIQPTPPVRQSKEIYMAKAGTFYAKFYEHLDWDKQFLDRQYNKEADENTLY